MSKDYARLRPDIKKLVDAAIDQQETYAIPSKHLRVIPIKVGRVETPFTFEFTSGATLAASIEFLPDECFTRALARYEVYEAIDKERSYQDQKWGADKPQSLPGFLLVIESELNEAKLGWMKNQLHRHSPLAEIVQIAATCVACLEHKPQMT
jgi:hypothetical protein